ncbi:branched-chain amino acid ABC transporter permease [Rubrobacter aplysinae]|uniref:branched-chain amino acid ABC transporter permease n=1 Tax=Rubrobacter aplysinae TaxID=909625 RepID=UPI00064BC9E1|nr:branched-chain amino acid ABC transporter permease [Rubrobacter aplysinae]
MELFLQQLVNGIALGSVYSLAALGLTLVFGVLRIPNLAHGALYMVGAYVTYFALTSYGIPYIAAIGVAAVVLAVIGVLMERLVFHPLRNAPHTHHLIAAVGMLFFLQSGAQVLWGSQFREMPSPFAGVVNVFGIGIGGQRILIIAASVVVMVGLFLFLKKTVPGQTIEAIEQDRTGASLVGIDANRVSMMTFGISAALAAVAAGLVAPINLLSPTMGDALNLKVFAIIILGGLGSIPGAIVGGFALALAEVFSNTYISNAFGEAIGFVFLLIVLAVRPTGLFSKGA